MKIMQAGCVWLLSCLAMHHAVAKELSELDFLGTGEMRVLSASRLDQPIMDAPNAITVLDRATIEASGYTRISDLFRLVPGMYVGHSKGWFHNVTHTMADEFARRMQVLVDGRSVYLPSIGGVRWDTLPLSIDDIERIEVVRGPNAATFGANALTGVINIITRHPDDVSGPMLHLITGDHSLGEAWFRWAGGGDTFSHRLTLGTREDGGFRTQHDDAVSKVINYRGNLRIDGASSLGLQAGLLQGRRGDGEVATGITILDALDQPHWQDVENAYVQGDYQRTLGEDQQLSLKLYFAEEASEADVPLRAGNFLLSAAPLIALNIPAGSYYESDLASRRLHIEGEWDAQLGPGQRTSVGAYLRRDSVRSEIYFNTREWLEVNSWGVFAHLEQRLSRSWLLNAGAFWEDYELVGGKLSPRVALNWQPDPRHTVRFGVSRAYRNPVLFESRADTNFSLLAANGVQFFKLGSLFLSSGAAEPEEVLSYEISYLGNWPGQGLSLDARVFRERVSDYISAERVPGVIYRDFFNIGRTIQEGMELQVKWQPRNSTQILANYAFLRIDSNFDEKRYSPSHLAGVHFMQTLSGDIGFTLSHYWTSAFEPIGQDPLPASRRWDARLAKGFNLGTAQAQLALGVENVGDSYLEFSPDPDNRFDTRGYVHFKVDF